MLAIAGRCACIALGFSILNTMIGLSSIGSSISPDYADGLLLPLIVLAGVLAGYSAYRLAKSNVERLMITTVSGIFTSYLTFQLTLLWFFVHYGFID